MCVVNYPLLSQRHPSHWVRYPLEYAQHILLSQKWTCHHSAQLRGQNRQAIWVLLARLVTGWVMHLKRQGDKNQQTNKQKTNINNNKNKQTNRTDSDFQRVFEKNTPPPQKKKKKVFMLDKLWLNLISWFLIIDKTANQQLTNEHMYINHI